MLAAAFVLALVAAASAAPGLFGMSEDLQFETIDLATGKPGQVLATLAAEGQAQGVSGADVQRGVFYIIGTNFTTETIALIGLSAANGSVLTSINLPFLLEAFVDVGQYVDADPVSGDVFVVGRSPSTYAHIIYRVTPSTGAIRKLASVHDGAEVIEVLGGISVYDSTNEILWIQIARNDSNNIVINFYGYDGQTGFLLYIILDQLGMSTFDFDPSSGLIYGVGYNGARTFVSFSSQTTLFTQIATIPDFIDLLSAVSAIDSVGQQLFVYMHNGTTGFADARHNIRHSHMVNDENLPNMDLVTISLTSGSIVSRRDACSQFPDCPWNIQWA
eukprot:m.557843 g.557843  ORF g.557843 m.557843 type:complete len:331 (-) comp57762_c0_seq1:132-1124(-)